MEMAEYEREKVKREKAAQKKARQKQKEKLKDAEYQEASRKLILTMIVPLAVFFILGIIGSVFESIENFIGRL